MESENKFIDTVRDLYLSKCTPEQHIELLEIEIKMNEEKMKFYDKSRLYPDELKHRAMISGYQKHIDNKYSEIKKLKKKIKQ
jgi:rubrerythrin